MNKYLKEIILWVLILLPYIYLGYAWNTLPERVPVHFNLAGTPNQWATKWVFLWIPAAVGVGIYALMLFIPVLDPKKKISQMGPKYYSLRLTFSLFFSAVTIYMIYLGGPGSWKNPGVIIALLGSLFILLGNYLQTIRPNYFIGIRTPWSLESEEVWKKTHLLGGRLWMAGGILIALLAFLIPDSAIRGITLGVIIAIMVIIPVVYSYVAFQKEKKMNSHP